MKQYIIYVFCLFVGYLACHIRSQTKEHVKISSFARKLTATTINGIATSEYDVHDGRLTPCIPLKIHDPEAGFSCMCHICMQ